MTASERPSCLPEDFLSTDPPADVRMNKIDFTKTVDAFPEYKGHYAVLIDNLLTQEECDILLRAAEESTISTSGAEPQWDPALINAGGGRQVYVPDDRNCSRIIWDSYWVADRILGRLLPFIKDDIGALCNVPKVTGLGPSKRNETWRLTRLNERLRFLRYRAGDFFRPHMDGVYTTPAGDERSYFTVHLYLNGVGNQRQNLSKKDRQLVTGPESKDASLIGGATAFHPPWMLDEGERVFKVDPKAGSVLVFQHRELAHSGDDVLQGTKYTMRTDIMYKNDELASS